VSAVPTPSSNGSGFGFKGNSGLDSVKDITGEVVSLSWLGDREWQVLATVHDLGLVRFTLADIWKEVGLDRRRVHDVVKRLMKRGIVKKIARGLYEVTVDLTKILSAPVRRLTGKVELPSSFTTKTPQKQDQETGVASKGQAQDTRVPRRLPSVYGVSVVGPRFDNVRGWRGGGFVGGDRGRVLFSGDLVFFDEVSYAEMQYLVSGVGELPEGLMIAVYTNWKQDRGGVRVEVRPPSGFVKHFGVAGLGRLYWESWLVAVKALLSLIREAPIDVFRRFVTWFAGQGFGKVVCAAVGA